MPSHPAEFAGPGRFRQPRLAGGAAPSPWGTRLQTLLPLLLGLAGPAHAQQAQNCGPIANAYGPFDYRTQRPRLAIVEEYHFPPHVEALIRRQGMSGVAIGGDLDYTLRASPNHHRALVSMSRYGERLRRDKVPGADYTVECYFDRAIRFAPDDPIVRMIYAGFLGRQNRLPEAERQLEAAARQAGDNAFTLYNIGLVYLELKRPAKALEFAHRAKALGWPRPELEQRLREQGQWQEPAPAAAAASQAASSAAPAPGSDGPAQAAPAASAPTAQP